VNRAVRDGVLRIELPGTPFDASLAAQLLEALPEADDLDAPPVLLVCAPPGGEFAGLGTADADVAAAADGAAPAPRGLRDGFPGGIVSRCVEALAAVTGITVVALSGDARGCGAELAIAADLRVAWSGARLGFPHVSFGLVPACGATQRLPRLVGPGAAFSALVLGGEISGDAMVELGLAAQSVATARESLIAAEQLAQQLAAQSATALRACKEAVLSGIDLPLRDGLRLEADLAILLQSTHDRREGINAFLEKRAPRFEGR
jgi:enoyl-CoA hydratase/carnithine racemase